MEFENGNGGLWASSEETAYGRSIFIFGLDFFLMEGEVGLVRLQTLSDLGVGRYTHSPGLLP